MSALPAIRPLWTSLTIIIEEKIKLNYKSIQFYHFVLF